MASANFICAVLLLAVCSDGIFAQTQTRDLKNYETGQIFDRKVDFTDKSAKILERAQAYLWDAWVNHKKVKFNIYEYNREGDRINLTLYVEPGANGEWLVEESSIIDECDDAGSIKRSCRFVPVVTVYDSVRWENLRLLTPPKPTETNIKILVLINSKTGNRYELRRGALF